MRFITGDETGLLKEITIRNNNSNKNGSPHNNTSFINNNNNNNIKIRRINTREKQSRSRSIISLAPLVSSSSSSSSSLLSSSFAALRIDNTIDFWRRGKTTTTTTTTNDDYYVKYRTIQNIGQSKPLSLKPLSHYYSNDGSSSSSSTADDDDDESSKSLMAAIDTMGTISILNDASIRTTYNTTYKKGGVISAFDVAGSTAAIGGRDRETVVMDLERGDVTWKAKNLPPDRQTLLEQQLWGSCLTFLSPTTTCLPLPPSSSSSSSSSSPSSHPYPLLAVGSAHKHVRIYDLRLQRRPVLTTPYHDSKVIFSHRITSIKQELNDFRLVIGDTAGFMYSLDMRKLDTVEGRFVGPAGSVRDMVVVSGDGEEERGGGGGGGGGGVVGSVGLDRHLWCHDVKTRKVKEKVYLKQRLNCVMMGWEQEDDEGEDDEGDEEAPDVVRDYVDSDDEEGGGNANKKGEAVAGDEEDHDGDYDVSGSSEEGDESNDSDEDDDEDDDSHGEERENYIDLSGDEDDDDDDSDGDSDSESDDEDDDKPQPSSKRRKM